MGIIKKTRVELKGANGSPEESKGAKGSKGEQIGAEEIQKEPRGAKSCAKFRLKTCGDIESPRLALN